MKLNFIEYNEDRNIPTQKYCKYLNKYNKKYQLETLEDGIVAIKCKFGTIEPNGLTKGLLGYWGSFHSIRKTHAYMKRLPDWIELTQQASDGFGIKFPESRLEELEEPLEIRKKKKCSPETLERLKKYAFSKRK
jgi:hypothetical protein